MIFIPPLTVMRFSERLSPLQCRNRQQSLCSCLACWCLPPQQAGDKKPCQGSDRYKFRCRSDRSDDIACNDFPDISIPMLVTFKTSAHADIIMFGDIAKQLLKMMGHSGTIPSAMVADEVPAALDRLRHAVEAERVDEAQK